MDPFEHAAVVAHFLAGNRVELAAVGGTPPADYEDGDAEYYGLRAIMAVTRQLKRADPSFRICSV